MNPELANNPGEAETLDPELANQPELQNDQPEVDPETGEPVPPKDDDTEEVEHEGQKYKLPKALKGALLMQQDYTRKTQEVADLRRAAEEQRTAVARQAQTQQEHFQDAARLYGLDQQIAEFQKVDWAALRTANRDEAESLWFSYQQVKDARDRAASELHAKVTRATHEGAAETAKRRTELATNLARDIPGYTPELAGKMTEYGVREFGFSPDEIAATTDPRLHRLLHRAMTRDEAQRKAATTAAAVATATAANGLKPTPKVGANTPAVRINLGAKEAERLPEDEWMRRRNQELRKKG